MYILGISCFYHDSSAALLKDGRVLAAAAEERFTRRKHDISFPINAIRFCLDRAGISIEKVNYIGFYEKPLQKFERVLYQHLEMFPKSFWAFFKTIPSWINQRLIVPKLLKKNFGYKKDIFFIEHHLCHAATSYLVSPYKEAAILTVDGVGEWITTTLGYAQENDISLNRQISFPHSLGLLYSTVTAHLGFKVNNAEYKIMGLSAYGQMDKAKNIFYKKMITDVIDIKEDGSYRLNMDYFVYHYKMSMPSRKFIKEFGGIRKKNEPLTQKHKDIAAAIQMVYEDVIFSMLRQLHKQTRCDNLCIAGGCVLNSVANGKILRSTPFRHIYIPPDPGDGGTSVGAAFYVYNCILGKKRNFILKDAFLGPDYSNEEIKQFLDKNNINYYTFKSDRELVEKTAELLKKNYIIGFFHSRMEWGPRALGNRSILANPTHPEMKDILNLKVKQREKFRPFAPVVCDDDVEKYFECDKPLPLPVTFMSMVYPIKKEKQKELPGAVHIDGSGRLQVVKREQHPLYYDLIKEFGRLTNTPVLINTSFNIKGEPIVVSPYYAYHCMMGTGIDFLVMDRFLIRREDNKPDTWDSSGQT